MLGGVSERRALSRDWDLAGDMAALAALPDNPGVPISDLVDLFDDNVRDVVKWSGSYGVVTEVGGRARVECSTGFSGYQSSDSYKLTSKRIFTRVYAPAAGGAATEAMCGQWFYSPVDAPAGTDIGFFIERVSNQIRFSYRTGYFDGSSVNITYDPVAHAYVGLRLDVDGGNHVIWETSPDAVTWTIQRTRVAPDWAVKTSTGHWLMEAHRDSGVNDYAEYDNVNALPSATTPVSATLDLRWQVLNTVASVLDLRWAVAAPVAGALDLRWGVRSLVSSAVDLRWAVAAPVSATLDLRWVVASTVSNALDLRWAVSGVVSSAVDLRWAVRSLVSAGMDLRWAVRSGVSASVDLRWAVASTVQAVLDVRWALRTLVEASLDLRWAQRALVASETELLWVVEPQELSPIPLPPTLAADLTLRVRSSPEQILVRYAGPRRITARLEE